MHDNLGGLLRKSQTVVARVVSGPMMPWEPGYYEGYALPRRLDGYILEPMKMGRKLQAECDAWVAELLKDEELIALLERLALATRRA